MQRIEISSSKNLPILWDHLILGIKLNVTLECFNNFIANVVLKCRRKLQTTKRYNFKKCLAVETRFKIIVLYLISKFQYTWLLCYFVFFRLLNSSTYEISIPRGRTFHIISRGRLRNSLRHKYIFHNYKIYLWYSSCHHNSIVR